MILNTIGISKLAGCIRQSTRDSQRVKSSHPQWGTWFTTLAYDDIILKIALKCDYISPSVAVEQIGTT